MSQGYLSVETRIADGGIPVEGARIYIIPSGQGSDVSESFYRNYMITDSSGNTGFIRFDAPDPKITENINNTVVPYSLVDVYAVADGFFPTRVRNVQIYGDTQSVLPITLIPANGSFTGTDSGVVIYDIPANQLMSADTHNMSGPNNEQTEPLIAEEIFIPEYVTVHLGTPASNARNVSVPFTEYIKNVASSEIYPTWPEESLRANVAAIISLTLNRFFTEWYRSQGYDFDITSTTSYDQSYVEGRNIFENISRIVDDTFNTYVTREGYINPLFTTFCDGRTVTCNGLSQWGTVSLAENGNNALQILRYYYGDDINLTSTDDIRSAQSSYPGTPLKLGDTGDDVVTIQQQLMRIRENYPAIPLIPTIDGVFGSSTDSAVRTFQEIFDLSVDGIVGKSTWYRISYVYSSVAKLAETIGEGVSDIFSEDIPNNTISLGDTGNYVLLLQSLLDYISVFYPSVPNIEKDGIFGQNTEDAVRQFQKTFGLTETGIVTPLVWNALYQVYLNIINSVTPVLPNQGFPGRDIRRGDSGENVKLMQTYLNAISSRYP
ncbi:MAG: peptidoglycan-binding protein, partial [Clostridia bacterium]|nr:peptidoglycan-binding protein [Clostridia bacterium]